MRVRSDKSPTQFVRNGLRATGVHVRSRAGKWNAIEVTPCRIFWRAIQCHVVQVDEWWIYDWLLFYLTLVFLHFILIKFKFFLEFVFITKYLNWDRMNYHNIHSRIFKFRSYVIILVPGRKSNASDHQIDKINISFHTILGKVSYQRIVTIN